MLKNTHWNNSSVSWKLPIHQAFMPYPLVSTSLPPSPSSFLFLSSINVMVHHYYCSLANALNSLAPLFPLYLWLAKAHPWLNPTILFCWTLGKNIHEVKLSYSVLNSWSQTSNGFKHNPEKFLFFSCCCWVKILCAVALIKNKKGLFVFCNWCDVPFPGLTYLVAEAKVGEMRE